MSKFGPGSLYRSSVEGIIFIFKNKIKLKSIFGGNCNFDKDETTSLISTEYEVY